MRDNHNPEKAPELQSARQGEKKPYRRPRIVMHENVEVIAAVCTAVPPATAKADPSCDVQFS